MPRSLAVFLADLLAALRFHSHVLYLAVVKHYSKLVSWVTSEISHRVERCMQLQTAHRLQFTERDRPEELNLILKGLARKPCATLLCQ